MAHLPPAFQPTWRSTAANPDPAVLGREPTETKNADQISERVRALL
jgi:hypothetical protein